MAQRAEASERERSQNLRRAQRQARDPLESAHSSNNESDPPSQSERTPGAHQQLTAAALRRTKQALRSQVGPLIRQRAEMAAEQAVASGGVRESARAISDTTSQLRKAATAKTAAGKAYRVAQASYSFARRLRAQADEGRLGVYLIAFALALFDDFVDIASLDLGKMVTWLMDIFLAVFLLTFLWGKGTWKIRLALGFAPLVELLPFIGVIPAWTISVLFAYQQDVQRRNILRRRADELSEGATLTAEEIEQAENQSG